MRRLALSAAVLVGCASSAPEPKSAELDPAVTLADADEPAAAPDTEGVAAIRDGNYELARSHFEKVVAAEPRNAEAHFYLGVARQNLDASEAAAESYRRAVSINPKLAEAWVNLSALQLDAGDAAGALRVVDEALAHHPDHGQLAYNRALALAALEGREQDAVAAYRKALAADPANVEIRYGYAEALVAAGAKREALDALRELAKSDQLEVLASTARLYGKLREFDACIQAFGRAIAIRQSSELYVERGLCAHGKKDDAAAYEDFQRAVRADANYAPGHYYVGMHLKTQGKKSEARAALARAVQLAGDQGVGKAAKRALDSL